MVQEMAIFLYQNCSNFSTVLIGIFMNKSLGWWVVQKSFKTPLRNIKMAPCIRSITRVLKGNQKGIGRDSDAESVSNLSYLLLYMIRSKLL